MNNSQAVLLGIVDDQEPWLGSGGSTGTTTTTPQKSLTDKIGEWMNLAKQGLETYQTVRNSDGTVTYVMPPPAPAGANNTMKYVLIGGGALLAIGAVVLLTKSSKPKKALGEVGAVKKSKKRKK